MLVGREQELAALRGILDAGGGVAIVSGEAGIGKSRLVREFAKEAEARGRIVLWARPEEVAQPGPYALIVDLLESIAERGGASGKTEARTLIDELTRTHAEGQRPAPAPRAVAAEVRGLSAQLGRLPLIVMEDLHWADESSHSVFLHLARAAPDDQHVYIGTLRPEVAVSEGSLGRLVDSLVRDRVVTEVPLSGLGAEDLASMLQQIWGRLPIQNELAELTRLGEGVPFFIEELANSDWGGQGPLVPRSIEQSVVPRVRALGDEAVRVMSAASLMSGAIDVAVLAVACDMADERVARHLASAARAGLLADHEDRLVFRHSLVREAIAGGLVSVEASETHGRIAAAIEKVHAGELELFVGELARHFREAGERKPAVEYTVRAGDRALGFAATEEARAAFKAALDLTAGDSTDALRGLAEVEFREGNEREAASLFRTAADVQRQAGDVVDAAQTLGRLAWALQGLVEAKEVLAVLDEGLALLSEQEQEIDYARLLVQKGSLLCFAFNEANRSRPILSQALTVAENARDFGVMAEALDGLAEASALEGIVDVALSLGARAMEAAKKSKRAETIGRTHNNQAVKLAASGQPLSSLELLAEGRQQMLSTYGRAAVGAMDVTQAWVMWLMGLPNEVAHLTARSRSAWLRWRGYRWLLEVWAAVERGELAVARARATEAWAELGGDEYFRDALSRAGDLDFESMQVVLTQALVERASGNFARSLELTAPLVSAGAGTMEPLDFVQLLTEHALALIETGELGEANATSDRIVELCSRYPFPYIRAHSLLLRGMLCSDDLDQAIELLENAAAEFDQCANSSDRARCERLLAGTLMTARGDDVKSEAIKHLRQAREISVRCGALNEANRSEALLRTMGVRPRAGRPKRDSATASSSGLSPRESEIASLVAAGDTNADIASRLFLSERTVQDHITHALRKLGFTSRAALAGWAVKQGMI